MTQPAPTQPSDIQIDINLYVRNLEEQRNSALSDAARWKAAYEQSQLNAQDVIGRLQQRLVELSGSGDGGEPAAGG